MAIEAAPRGRLARATEAFRTALWFGLAAGFVELLLLVVRVEAQEQGFFLRSRHFVWMVPASVVMTFTALGMVAAAFAMLSGRTAVRRSTLGLFIFTAFLGWFLLIRGLEAAACGLIALGFAARGAPRLDRRRDGLRRLVDRSLPALAATLVVLAAASFWRDSREAVAGPPAPPAAGEARNVLLIVLDTVRADRLSLYGYGRDTTPYLRRLAGESTVFSQARAAAAWTLPSHASMFTGRWASQLGVERRGWLDSSAPSLAEGFRDAGYATAGFVANPFFCGRESGLARGFQVYADYPVTPGEVFRSSALGWLAARTSLRLGAWLAPRATAGAVRDVDLDFSRKDAATVGREFNGWLGRNDGRPFFAFLNLFDAHDPYIPPAGFAARFDADSTPDTPDLLRDWQRVDKAGLSPRDVRAARDAYDDCLAALDAQLGELIESLRERGVLDRTILVVTADHGEQFGEHGAFGHGLSVYDEEVRVPLLIRAPGLVPAGRIVDAEVDLRDLAATTFDLAGVADGPGPFCGGSLATTWRDVPTSISTAFSELRGPVDDRQARPAEAPDETPPDSWKGVVVAGHSYIRRGDGRESLFDLAADPGQSVDRLDDPEKCGPLEACRRAMDRLLGEMTPRADGLSSGVRGGP